MFVTAYLRKYLRTFCSLDWKRTPKLRTDWQQFGLFFIAMVQPVDLRHFGTWEKVIQLDFQFVCIFLGTFDPLGIQYFEIAFPHYSGWKPS